MTAADLCVATPAGDHPWNVNSPDVVEASGLASSRADEDFLWIHNDSGDSARVFSIDRQGNHHATFTLAGAEAIDWEDMAIGPGPEAGVSYLYLADSGDNAAVREGIVVYRVPEPDVNTSDTLTARGFDNVAALELRYPDRPHDAETLLVDPLTGDLVIVTKELAGGPSFVFRAPGSIEPGTVTTLEEVSTINFAGLDSQVEVPADAPALVLGLSDLPTGGDISPDGKLIIIRTYGSIWVWDRPEEGPLWDFVRTLPCEAPSEIEPQGETIAFDADGRGYTTVSEGANPPLYHFRVE
jgi:hypothetical protein